MFRTLLILIVTHMFLAPNVIAQEQETLDGYTLPGVSSNFYYDYSKNTKLFGMDGGMIADYNDGYIEFSASISFLRFVRIDGHTIYSLGLPVTLGLWEIGKLADNIFLGKDSTLSSLSQQERVGPFLMLFLLPNSVFRFRVTNSIRPTLSFSTEYLLYSNGGSSKGVLFTPRLGLTIYKREGNAGRYGWEIHVGRSMFWSFDNKNRATEFIVGITMFGYPID